MSYQGLSSEDKRQGKLRKYECLVSYFMTTEDYRRAKGNKVFFMKIG